MSTIEPTEEQRKAGTGITMSSIEEADTLGERHRRRAAGREGGAMNKFDVWLCRFRIWRRLRGGVWWTSTTFTSTSPIAGRDEWFKAEREAEDRWAKRASSRVRAGLSIGHVVVEDWR